MASEEDAAMEQMFHQFLTDHAVNSGMDEDEESDSNGDDDSQTDPKNIPNLSDRLLYAAEINRMDMIHEVLQHDPSLIHTTDSDGYTALHRASYNNHVEVVKELVRRGANVRAGTLDGWQPLHSACRWNCVEAARVLLHNGGDVNAQTGMGLTPLHLAAADRDGRDLLVLLLADKCVDRSIRSRAGETAETIARRCGPNGDLFEMVL